MNAKLFLLCFVSTLTASAADPPAQINSTLRTAIQITEAERLQVLLAPKKDVPVINLGHSGFYLSGPLAYGFRRLPPEENLSRGQKFLRLPLIRLFVPGPMERPPETGGKYFAWRNDESTLPWAAAASRPPVIKGSEFSPAVRVDAKTPHGFLNLHWGKH